MKSTLFSTLIIVAAVLAFSSGVFFVSADNNPHGVINPRPAGEAVPQADQTPAFFMSNLYMWMLGFVGIAALFALVYGGVLYIFSGAVSSTAEARRWITNAIVGLLIAGASYLILNTINPDLVKGFKLPNIQNNIGGH